MAAPNGYSFTPSPTTLAIAFPNVRDAKLYVVKYGKTGSTAVVTDQSPLRTRLYLNLTPATSYTVSIYSSIGTAQTLMYTATVSTLSSSLASFSKAALTNTGQLPDLTNLTAANGLTPEAVAKSIFTTGDAVMVKGKAVTATANYVAPGASTTVKKNTNVYIPFEAAAGNAQTVTLTHPDYSTSVVTYNATANSITVGGVERKVGTSFSLGGQQVTVIAQ